MPDDARFTRLRSQMPIAEKWAYFDHAAVSPLPGPAREALVRYATEAAVDGNTAWMTWSRRLEHVRTLAAQLVGASTSEIALVRNTTEAITLVAEGLPWRSGDNVVIPANEFPSNAYPWMNLASRGVEVRRIPVEGPELDLAALVSACDRRTRIVSVSWVGYATGWRADLDRLAEDVHRRGALLLVDAIQALGAFPIDVAQTPIDFLAADGHKWMLGPEGAGLLYVRSEHLPQLRTIGVGWNSVVHSHDYTKIALELKPSAARFEGGSANMPGFQALGASLEMLLECGIAEIAARVLEVTDVACERLQARGARIYSSRSGAGRSGIVAFEIPGQDAQALRRKCLERGVVLGCRAGRLRISPHAYANDADLDRLIAALAD